MPNQKHVFFVCLVAVSVLFGPSFISAQTVVQQQKLEPLKPSGPDTLVICPKAFQSALTPWIEHRQRQGHKLALAVPPKDSYSLRMAIRKYAQSGALKNVVLVGDSGDRKQRPENLVPIDYVPAKVNRHFGSDPEIATDNTYADLDDDGVVDLAIGRMPVDSAAELSTLVSRIIQYESNTSHGMWQRRVNFVAGVGGFGQMIDKLIETTTKRIISDLIPAEYETSMTYGSWMSPYCPDPRRFSETSIGRFNEGCMFWVYIGHGSRHALDKIYMPDQSHQILTCENVSKLSANEGSPIAIFLACYTGATDDPKDCLAEEMIRQPKGPIAIVAGSRVTMPYAMSLMSLEMLEEFFKGDVETLGQLVKLAKQRMVNGSDTNPEYRNMIEGMGKAFSPKPELMKKERLEHVQLMQLIGDPLLRLKRPGKIELEVASTVKSGTPLKVSGKVVGASGVPSSGKLLVEISYTRDRLRNRPPRRREYDSSNESFNLYQTTYLKTHQQVCSSKTLDVVDGTFEAYVDVPADASGTCDVRAVLLNAKEIAMGSSRISIKKTRSPRTANGSSGKPNSK